MRLLATVALLLTGLALPAEGAGMGADLSAVMLAGLSLGESAEAVRAAEPKAKVSWQRDAKVKNMVVGGQVVFSRSEDGVSRQVVAKLTRDGRIYDISIDERPPETAVGHPATYLQSWIERFGPPTTDYDAADEESPIYLSWFDMPRRERILSISLEFEQLGECASLKPEGLDCAKHKFAYGKFQAHYLFKDRSAELENQRMNDRALRAAQGGGDKKKKKKK